MTKHYIILAIISIFIGTAAAQQSELPKTVPFFKSHTATAIRPSTMAFLQKAKASNSSTETTYTHRIDSVITLMYDQTNTNIVRQKKLSCIYKDNKFIEMDYWIRSSTDSKYEIQQKYIYAYDIQNRVDSMYELYFSETDSQIEHGDSYHYIYDNSNRINSISQSLWTSPGSGWSQTTTTYYQYAGSNISRETIQNTATGNVSKYIYHFFDAYKNDTLTKNYIVSNNVKHLNYTTHTKYTYGTAGNVLNSNYSEYYISYSDSTTQSLTYYKTANYDNNGNIDNYSETDINSSTGAIDSQFSFTTTDIDLNYKTAEILGYDKLQIPIYPNNMTKQWNVNMDGTALTHKFYFSPLIKDGLSNTNASQTVKVLSGTTAGSAHLQMPNEANYTAAIYNAAGSKIQTIHTNSSTIAINQLAAGVHIYSIHSDTQNFNGKFIVK